MSDPKVFRTFIPEALEEKLDKKLVEEICELSERLVRLSPQLNGGGS